MATFLNWWLVPFHCSCVAFGLMIVCGIGAFIQMNKMEKNAKVLHKLLTESK